MSNPLSTLRQNRVEPASITHCSDDVINTSNLHLKAKDDETHSEVRRRSSTTATSDATPGWKRLYSIASSSASDQRRVIQQLTESSSGLRSAFVQYAKMLGVVGVPIIAVIVVFGVLLSDSIAAKNDVETIDADFRTFAVIDAVVTGLRTERGISAMVVMTNGTNWTSADLLQTYRAQTDEALAALQPWPTVLQAGNAALGSKLDLNLMLTAARAQVDDARVDYNYVIDLYSNVTSEFIDWVEVCIIICPHYRPINCRAILQFA